MGLLDDAIREHLDLKRRHGADAGELSRQEAEAFGPARREPPPARLDEEVEPEPFAEEAVAEGAFAEEAVPEEAAVAEEHLAEEAVVEEPLVADEAVAEEGAVEEPLVADEAVAEEGAPAGLPEPEPYAAQPVDEPVAPAPEAAEPEGYAAEPLEPEPASPPRERSGGTPPYGTPAVVPEGGADVVPEGGADDEPLEDEDVLEDTPDFLQETPEHDRLWFEQKPPRDFDFDD